MRIVKYSWRYEIKITQADAIMGIKTVRIVDGWFGTKFSIYILVMFS